jgi:tetratricopeptide (TPR) repeat protein
MAPQALAEAAELLMAGGQPAKAAGYFERIVEMPGAPAGMKMLARRGLAASFEESGDVEKAIAQYLALAEASSAQEAVEADWDAGRCYELLKDSENAKSFYRKAVESGGDSKWAELARFRVESLARGPESIASAPAATASAPAATSAAPAATVGPATIRVEPVPPASAPAATASTPASTPSMPSSTESTPSPTAAPAATASPAAAGTTAPE